MLNKKKILQTSEQKLAALLGEMNAEKRVDNGKLICETEISLARIQAYSDFMYALKMKPWQTFCYYAAGFFFLLTGSAIWTREWVLTAIFAVLFFVFASLPSNMRTRYFNRNADVLDSMTDVALNVEFAPEKLIVTQYEPRKPDDNTPREPQKTAEFPYEALTAVECSHSFYIFPEKSETLICDKTLFLCGTPMALRDHLARKLGKKFRIKTKLK